MSNGRPLASSVFFLTRDGKTRVVIPSASPSKEESMARDQNTYLKRQREMEKKRKAEEKRARRQKKKEEANNPAADPDVVDPAAAEE
jgi:hypothetical protein